MIRPTVIAPCALLALAACGDMSGADTKAVQRLDTPPPGAAPGTCWAQDTSPAVVETVTEQILVSPAEVADDGTVTRPASYRTETAQKIVQERRVTRFQVPCRAELTPEFNTSVQRALKARGLYRGPINGQLDRGTRAAIRRFQKPQGFDSDILSIAGARQLGLIAVARDTPDTPG
ncbi:Putative peptidoglycan binding domain protein [Roseovarius sp. THAF9]|uniref:peptidoglycan-binding domain-containing protein n=1 Tax=Roseovarius sp. THAF9 TaxID=2587847 RepID=UPI0012693D27|nr:peptidoglycan-binding domain-containing protein [Roseovarius sp. THAF9]QFT93507.1 Putative peptidoglycan binding domain protein [Roseovarius sp. THAF9]